MSLPADNIFGTTSSSTRPRQACWPIKPPRPLQPPSCQLSGARLPTALRCVPWLAGWGSTLPLLLLGGPSGSGAACCQGLAAALLPAQVRCRPHTAGHALVSRCLPTVARAAEQAQHSCTHLLGLSVQSCSGSCCPVISEAPVQCCPSSWPLLTMSNSCPCLLRHLPVMVKSRSDPLCHRPEQKEPNSISCTRHCSLLPLLHPCWWYLHARPVSNTGLGPGVLATVVCEFRSCIIL